MAPRFLAWESDSSTTEPAPSPQTKPSRPLSHGRLARCGSPLRRESANIALNPPMPSPVIVASAPPASIIPVRPRRIHSNASPSAWALEAQALVLQ